MSRGSKTVAAMMKEEEPQANFMAWFYRLFYCFLMGLVTVGAVFLFGVRVGELGVGVAILGAATTVLSSWAVYAVMRNPQVHKMRPGGPGLAPKWSATTST